MTSFVAIGDLHFDSKLSRYPGLEGLNHIIYKQVQIPLNYARKSGIKYVVLLGDVCDTRTMSAEAHGLLLQLFQEYRDLVFLIITGNHDTSATGVTSLDIIEQVVKRSDFKNVRILKKPTVLFGKQGTPINFLPWPSFDVRKDCLNVVHIDPHGAKSDHGTIMANDRKTDFNLLCGHVHTMQELSNNQLIVGTLYQTKFSESEDKYFADCSWDGTTFTYNLVKVELPFKLRSIVIRSEEDLEEKAVPEDHVFYRAIVKENTGISPNALAKYPNVVKTNRFKTKEELGALLSGSDIIRIDQEEITSSASTEKALVQWMEHQKIDSDLQTRVVELLDSILKKSIKESK